MLAPSDMSDISVTTTQIVPGEVTVPNKPYACNVDGCSAAFQRPSRLEYHKRVHSGERPFKCQLCLQSYTRAYHLKRHVTSVHERTSVQVFQCPVEGCGKQYTSMQSMRKHHDTYHSAERLKCSYCMKSFKKNQHLKIHQYEHTGVLPYKCEYNGCEKRFLLPSKLKAHTKTHKGYICDINDCNQHFSFWSALLKHKAEAHVKEYTCETCNAVFKRRNYLKQHLKKHESTREVFHCPFDNCKRWSYYKNNLRAHIDKYHNPGQFKCEEEGCGKTFNYKVSLKSHIARHRNPLSEKERNNKTSENSKATKKRSDKGLPKKAVATILSGYPATSDENKEIMRRLD